MLSSSTIFEDAIADHLSVVEQLRAQQATLERIATEMTRAIMAGNKILWCGNGGSAGDAQHLAAELVGFKPGLLELIPAGGVVVSLEGQVHTLGQTPPAAFIAELMDWLKTQSQPLIESHELSAVFPAAAAHTATASGMLSISLSREPVDYVVWFRPELAHTITWAGMPGKPVQSGHLPPRKSFAAFPQQIKRKSAPWDTIDIEAARTLRVWLLETVLRQIDIARQEREAAFAHQALLMAELDHRVKNTLANIQGLVRQTKVGATSLDNYTLALERRIRAMAHAHSLIAETRWHGAPLGSLVKTELAPYRRRNKNQFNITGANVVLSPQAALPVTLVLHELTSNAAKYGALSSEHGCIDIAWHLDGENLVLTWRERNGPAVQPPQRRGFGSVIIERSLRHEIQGHSVLTFDPAGVTCTITFPAKYIVPHNNKEAQSV